MKRTVRADKMTVSQIVTAIKGLFKRDENLEEVTVEMYGCAVQFNTHEIDYTKGPEKCISVTLNRFMTDQEMYDEIVKSLNNSKEELLEQEEFN